MLRNRVMRDWEGEWVDIEYCEREILTSKLKYLQPHIFFKST